MHDWSSDSTVQASAESASDHEETDSFSTALITNWKQLVSEIADKPCRHFNYRFNFHIASIALCCLASRTFLGSFTIIITP